MLNRCTAVDLLIVVEQPIWKNGNDRVIECILISLEYQFMNSMFQILFNLVGE